MQVIKLSAILLSFFKLMVIPLLLTSCQRIDNRTDKIARVYDNYLYLSDIQNILSSGISGQDSTDYVNNYIDAWIRQQLILHQAEQSLQSDDKDIAQQIEEYRRSLLIFKFESEVIRRKLDTIVDEIEIEKYYNANPQNFELKDNIVRVNYVKLLHKAPNISLFRKYVQSSDNADKTKLIDLCQRYAVNFFLDDDTWLFFTDVLKEIPIKTYDKEAYLKNNRFIEFQDSAYLYLLNIKGFQISESISPLSFERDRIKSMIINKRKTMLIAKMHDEIYLEAIRKGKIEISRKQQ